jgi:hypothetical protein
MGLASRHPCGTYNFEVTVRFLDTLHTPGIMRKCIILGKNNCVIFKARVKMLIDLNRESCVDRLATLNDQE